MDDLQFIKNAINSSSKIVAEREYGIYTIKGHLGVFNSLLKFMKENNFTKPNEEVEVAYIKQETDTSLKGFWGLPIVKRTGL